MVYGSHRYLSAYNCKSLTVLRRWKSQGTYNASDMSEKDLAH